MNMKLARLLGALVAIVGAIGLALFADAIVGVFELLTLKIVDPPEPLPTALAELKLIPFLGITLLGGLWICSAATGFRDNKQTLSMMGKILYIVAGGLLIVATAPMLWAMMNATYSFHVIATSASAPDLVMISDMIQSVAPTISIGCCLYVIAAVLLLVSAFVGFQTKSPEETGSQPVSMLTRCAVFGSLLVAIITSLLFATLLIHANKLGTQFDFSTQPDPAEIGVQFAGIIFKSALIFIGLGVMGLMQVLTVILRPTATAVATTEETAD